MGVPKFFRYLSDRYPCINKIIKEHEIPKFDNLYIDMNSIVHTCSHPTDCDVHFQIGKKEFSDEDIFLNLSRYVELIFSIIKPKDLMFLAFDGVAPRAKMNQQRANRFRVARDINKSTVDREIMNEETLFDGNCITPGTIFMAELIDHMRHFIAFKISTDPGWQKCKIILSGSEVPGEGEHKIMNFIRFNKAQKDYNPNTYHCLYSLDADLIILGLCSHEPHFSLIRENIAFGKSKRMITPEESDFHLLHLSVLREYIEHEFDSVKANLKFEFDLEKIIDDWVLLGFLVGNDFIPQLPNLHIVQGALSFLYKTYIQVLPTLDGYINEAGNLNLCRFEKFMSHLSFIEKKLLNLNPVESLETLDLKKEKFEDLNKIFEKLDTKLDIKDDKNENKSLTNNGFYSLNEDYYKKKFKVDIIDGSTMKSLVEEYIKAIQWTLSYYYHECKSWSWFYPYHYAPLISDIKGFQNISFNFDLGKPFLPLQHLMAVLPSKNKHLLPVPFHYLLTDSKSPIIDFYPENFEVDMNGKSNDWEAVVLIPFIEEKRLIEAMKPFNSKLSKKEQKRNLNGLACVFTFSKTSLGQYPIDTVFDSFTNRAQLEYMNPQEMFLPAEKLVKGLSPNVSFQLTFPSFPTLKYVHHKSSLEQIEPKDNRFKKTEKMILNVTSKPVIPLDECAKNLLGQTVYINWPHLLEAYIIGVTDLNKNIFLINIWQKYSTENLRRKMLNESEKSSIHQDLASFAEGYKTHLGIDIGDTQILVYVFPIMGKYQKIIPSGKLQLQTKYSSTFKLFPYQLIVKEENTKSVTFTMFKEITDILTASSTWFLIGNQNYGSIGQIKNIIDIKQQKVLVTVNITKDIDTSTIKEDFFTPEFQYNAVHLLAKKLKINSVIIKRTTGSLLLFDKSNEVNEIKCLDIGLNMKSQKQNKEIFGYIKKKNESWLYSEKVEEVIKSYMEKFPKLFENLSKNPSCQNFALLDIFPGGLEEFSQVKMWLNEQKLLYPTFIECYTKTLGVDAVPKLEKCISDLSSKSHESKVVEIKVLLRDLFKPGMIVGLIPPDVKAQHKLLDRVICIREKYTVPIGMQGTIIGIQEKEEKWENIYEILFDSSFTGGLTIYQSSEHRCYRLSVADFINISYGKRALPNKKTSNDSSRTNHESTQTDAIKKQSTNNNKTNLKNFKSKKSQSNNHNSTPEEAASNKIPQNNHATRSNHSATKKSYKNVRNFSKPNNDAKKKLSLKSVSNTHSPVTLHVSSTNNSPAVITASNIDNQSNNKLPQTVEPTKKHNKNLFHKNKATRFHKKNQKKSEVQPNQNTQNSEPDRGPATPKEKETKRQN